VILAIAIGLFLGLLAGYVSGWIESVVMRFADIQLSFPAILVALLISGVVSATFERDTQNLLALPVLVFSIGLSD
ncbi:hypothetical protein V6760_13045, partial [Acinetobacter venetianus]